MSNQKRNSTEVSLNDALSESSLNISELQKVETPVNVRKKRHLEESPGFILASQVFSKAKKSLIETPVRPETFPDPWDSDFVTDVEIPILTQKIISRIKSDESTSEVLYSQSTGAHYVKRQRKFVEKNEENVIDDDISLVNNSQVNTSQYRRDLERVFDDCENSILQKNEAVVAGLSKIDWDDDDFGHGNQSQVTVMKCTVKTQSSHGAVKLAPISSSTFNELGPFFGLPITVKKLIKEFKGIEELYGKSNFYDF